MKKTNLTSIEQVRLDNNFKKLFRFLPLFGLFLFINSFSINAQNCVMACINTQVSVDQNCEAEITWDMVSKPSDCSGDYLVEVLGDDHLPIPTSPVVTGEYVDETLTVRVTDIPSGNYCWSTIHIEDKMPPQIECSTDTVACWTLIDYDGPIVSDNCTDTDDIVVTLSNESFDLLSCDSNFVQIIYRTYTATDASGNSSSCTRTYYLERIDLEEVEFPSNFSVAEGSAISCDEDFPMDANGKPDPSFTGVPTIDGVSLFPKHGTFCNTFTTYSDLVLPSLNCKEKIMRTWAVREYWCNTEIVRTYVQVIEIVDEEGPEVVCPADVTVSTSTNGCSGTVFLPPAIVSDNCNEVDRVDVSFPGGILEDSNGGIVNLEVGENTVVYTAFDECGNSNSCQMTVTVVDQTPPVAVCKTVTVVSLGSNGLAKVYAEVFDNGSYDECGLDFLEVARMDPACGYDTEFGPYVEFSCCDIANNLTMVVVRVWDEAGNFNECMVEVEVQDKLPATISCPPDITISCQFIFNPDDLDIFGTVVEVENLLDLQDPNLDPRNPIIISDPNNPNVSDPNNWGLDGFAYDNCEVEVFESSSTNIDQCGGGEITRTFTAIGPGGPSTSCVQTISVNNFFPFNPSNIIWPDDVTIENDPGMCDPGDLGPDVTGRPILNAGICDLVAANDPEDHVFFFSSPDDPSCFKILRKWKVIDWCQFNNGQYEIWEHTQTIKVKNTIGPVFTSDCEDVSVTSFDPNCSAAFVELTQEAEDDCTSEEDLVWSYQIDAFNNGTIDFTNNNNPFAAAGNAPNEASGEYPLGVHRIIWTVEDGCGNRTSCSHLFEIVNGKQPSPICYNGLAVELMPMDLNDDGIADWAELDVKAEWFDAGSFHSCGYDITFSFSPDISDTTKLFNCDSLGQRFVEIWVTDENGNQDYCITYVIVQDNNEVCPDSGSGSGGAIAGLIANPENEPVENVSVYLEGSAIAPSMSNENGFFGFTSVPFNEDYEIVPFKNDDPLNGVTTYDIVLMQRHILGISPFQDPYQYFAADINRSGDVNVVDVAELRRLILGTNENFANNNSWRFIDMYHQFAQGNPLNSNFNETYVVRNFNQALLDASFTAVKVGDLNGSATANSNVSEERTSGQPLAFMVDDRSFERGELVTIPFRAADFADLLGFQGTFMFDTEVFELIDLKEGMVDIDDHNFGFTYLSEGLLTVSWSDVSAMELNQNEVLFELTFHAKQSGAVSDYLFMGSVITSAEIYTESENRPLEIRFDRTVEGDGYVLYQNRPNPFKDETIIGFRLPENQTATLSIFDVTGKLIFQQTSDFTAGYNELTISGNDLPGSGVMYYRLDAENFNASRKMIILE